MTLRGTRSINGDNSPLFIIDGMEGSYDELNPNDIASIEVLKDCLLYTSLITTELSATLYWVIMISLQDGS